MITFNRSQVVGAQFPDPQTVRFSGVQEDHIYGMEIQMDVRVTDGQILAIEGTMKRYTNFMCPKAVGVLQTAVGLSLRQAGWEQQVMREIGRKGCEHFAEIVIECGRCLDPALMTRALSEALKADPALDQAEFTQRWTEEHPTAHGE